MYNRPKRHTKANGGFWIEEEMMRAAMAERGRLLRAHDPYDPENPYRTGNLAARLNIPGPTISQWEHFGRFPNCLLAFQHFLHALDLKLHIEIRNAKGEAIYSGPD